MNEIEALEYAAKILEAQAAMHYGYPLKESKLNEGYFAAVKKLREVGNNPAWREVLEQRG